MEHRAFTAYLRHGARTLVDGALHPRQCPLRGFFVDKRSHERRIVVRRTDAQFVGPVGHFLGECVVHRGIDVNALQRNAYLPRIDERSLRAAFRRRVEIGAAVDKGRGVAAEFETDFFDARLARNDIADGYRSCKTDLSRNIAADQCRPYLGIAVHDTERIFDGIGTFDEHFGETVGAQRRFGRGLEHDRIACDQRGGELVRNEVERKIERRDRRDDADGFAQVERRRLFAAGHGVGIDRLAAHRAHRLGRQRHGFDRPIDLDARKRDRFADLVGDGSGHLFFVFPQPRRHVVQPGTPLRQRRIFRRFGRRFGDLQRLVRIVCRTYRRPRHDPAVKRAAALAPAFRLRFG